MTAVKSQHATIVLPTTGAFDSRAQRLTATLVGRGHRVTVVVRANPSGEESESAYPGAEVLSIEANAIDGLPVPAWLRERIRSRSSRRPSADTVRPTRLSGLIRTIDVVLRSRGQARVAAGQAPASDVVHAMAFLGLPVARSIAQRAPTPTPTIYDARDIYSDARNIARLPAPLRRAFTWNERRWARQASRVVTVNDAYADVLESRLGPPRPLVVMNCVTVEDLPAERRRRFHDALGLDSTVRVVLYHGGLTADRGIEQLVESLEHLPEDVVLVLLGYGELAASMEAKAVDPALSGRLRVLPAVPPSELASWVASADIAAMPIQPTTLNHRLTTPNKLWEAMAAGVPVVASDLPGMSAIVDDTGCGVLCDPTDPAAIASAIRVVLDAPDEERAAYGRRGREAVRNRFNWNAQVAIMLDEYARLTGRPW